MPSGEKVSALQDGMVSLCSGSRGLLLYSIFMDTKGGHVNGSDNEQSPK